jgi:hypothetical protein
MTRIIFIFLIIFSAGCTGSAQFLSVSKKIYLDRDKLKNMPPFNIDSLFRLAREKAHNKADFLKNTLPDTLYFLEAYTLENRLIDGRIFGGGKKIDYEYHNGSLIIPEKLAFTAYQIQLVSIWDTARIREAEKKPLLDSRILKGTRSIVKGGDVKIDEIWFNDFFDPKRD